MQTITKTFTFLGVAFPQLVPASAQDWDEAVGSAGDCIEVAVNEHGYRGLGTAIRREQIKAVEALGAGYERQEKETEGKYIERIKAEKGLTHAEFTKLSLAAVDAAKVTYLGTLTATGSRAKIGQSWLDTAQEIMEYWRAGVGPTGAPSSVEITLEKIRQVLPAAELADPTDVEALARLLRDRAAAVAKSAVV